MYNMGDTSFQSRPRLMSLDTAKLAINRIADYVRSEGTNFVFIEIHGGEPLLAKKDWTYKFLDYAKITLSPIAQLQFGLQTNGTLIDSDWIDLFSEFEIGVGVSIDGTRDAHDTFRYDHKNRPSYDKVVRGIDLLRKNENRIPKWGVLSVANPSYRSIDAYKQFVEIGVKNMDFLWPDHHYDNAPPWPKGSLSTFYNVLFDYWFDRGDSSISIRYFESVIRLLMGERSGVEGLGGNPISSVTIETDGAVEALDVMRICGNGFTRSDVTIIKDSIEKIKSDKTYMICVNNQNLISEKCASCNILHVCGGGYLPHRFSQALGFSNPSIYCDEIYNTVGHIHKKVSRELDV
ncbi:MAG: hypothetical protein IOC63_17400 [Methylobacterium sp.]|nr:hypothetical protein [Methylobacterium sp.]